MKRVGFIGLGNMGFPMAANLLKAGLEIDAYDISVERLEEAKKLGMHIKDSPNNVSGLVVKQLISLMFLEFSISNLISHPNDFPIQFFCITFTLFGQSVRPFNPSKSSLANFVILKNH